MSFKCGGEGETCLLQPENSPQWRLMEFCTWAHANIVFSSQGERAYRQWGRSMHIFLRVVGVRRERVDVYCLCVCPIVGLLFSVRCGLSAGQRHETKENRRKTQYEGGFISPINKIDWLKKSQSLCM